MDKIRLGLALTGSYCSFGKLQAVLPELCRQFDVLPIFSANAMKDSRFVSRIAEITTRIASSWVNFGADVRYNGTVINAFFSSDKGKTHSLSTKKP